MLERTSVTYLLTFERSDLKTDGAYHRLKVKAKLPPGARLTHRAGYYAPRPFKELDPLEKNLLASDGIASAAPRRDLDLNVLAAPFRATAEPVLRAGDHRGRRHAACSTGRAAGEEAGRRDLRLRQRPQGADARLLQPPGGARPRQGQAGASRCEEGGLKYYGHFDLAPGSYQVRVLVRNADTGRTGVQTVRGEVPAYAQAQPVAAAALLHGGAPEVAAGARAGSGGRQRASVVYPFTVYGEPYVPAARPVLTGEKPARLCLVAYNLGKGDLAVQGEVLAADGKASAAGRLSRSSARPPASRGSTSWSPPSTPRGSPPATTSCGWR